MEVQINESFMQGMQKVLMFLATIPRDASFRVDADHIIAFIQSVVVVPSQQGKHSSRAGEQSCGCSD
jgi:hypothetical protein